MKVLFVASNPKLSGSLNLQVEITALQSEFMSESVEPISFAFLPALEVEKLPEVLESFKPDILHISAHASDNVLSLANESGDREDVGRVPAAGIPTPSDLPQRLQFQGDRQIAC
jgi:hypothetical protein